MAKYYVPLEEVEKHQLETEVHRVVVNRDPKHATFVRFKSHKLVYRRYAGLFFTLCVDSNDNELVHLESIHLFVEILDHFFANVCELDLVFQLPGCDTSSWMSSYFGSARGRQESDNEQVS